MHRVWKVAAIMFALSTALLWTHTRRLDAPVAPRVEVSRPGAGLAQRIAASRADLAEDALLDALRASDDTAQIVRLLAELGIVGSERALTALASFADDARPGVAEAALAAIGSIGGDAAAELVFAACDHGRLRTRQAAVAALARLDSEPAIARLNAIARDRSNPLWRTALTALASAGSPAALATLRELARARDPEVRVMALSAISDASRETVALLEAALASGDGNTAGAAAHALARARGAAAVPILIRAATEGGPAGQPSCIAALGDLGGDDARRALAGLIERGAPAQANAALGRLDAKVADAIAAAADEILAGQFRDQFIVDVYQAGAGTSHNMNANEVLANRAGEMLGEPRGSYKRVHPNDHVNMGQSTNDVYPASTRLALLAGCDGLVRSARELAESLAGKAREFGDALKTGRTHLQDAVPMTFGQEFGGYATNVRRGADEVEKASRQLLELNLGGTAVGTGLNAGEDYRRLVVANLAGETGLALQPAENAFRVTQSMGDVLAYSSAVRRLAIEAGKIASDLRLLSMGPRAGLSEIALPAVQPGSSIMPGKVNPSVPEMVNQVVFQVIGCDQTIAIACEAGQLELNVMMPVIAWNAIHASTILRQSMIVFRARCVDGMVADTARARELLERSTATATALSPYIGYAATAEIAKESVKTGKTIRELVLERRLLEPDRLDEILSPDAMTKGGVVGTGDAGKADRTGAHEK